MKKEVILTRDDDHYGRYTLWEADSEPCLWGSFFYYWMDEDNNFILNKLCPEETKKWFGLKKHLRKGTKKRIMLEVNCEVVK